MGRYLTAEYLKSTGVLGITVTAFCFIASTIYYKLGPVLSPECGNIWFDQEFPECRTAYVAIFDVLLPVTAIIVYGIALRLIDREKKWLRLFARSIGAPLVFALAVFMFSWGVSIFDASDQHIESDAASIVVIAVLMALLYGSHLIVKYLATRLFDKTGS